MLAKDVMSQPVVTVRPDTDIAEAGRLLTRLGYTALPVIDGDGGPVGMVTEHDLLRGRVPHDPRLHPAPQPHLPDSTVGAVMSVPAECVTPGTDVADVAHIMVQQRIRAVPVVDKDRLVGIITRRDILRAAIGRTDVELTEAVREALATLDDDPDRFTVWVTGAVAEVEDHRPDPKTDVVAERVVRTVPGVVDATVEYQPIDPF